MVTEHEVKRYQSCMRQETEGTNPKEREPPPTGPGYGNLKSRGPHLRKPFHKWSPVTARQLCMNAIAPDKIFPPFSPSSLKLVVFPRCPRGTYCWRGRNPYGPDPGSAVLIYNTTNNARHPKRGMSARGTRSPYILLQVSRTTSSNLNYIT